MNSYTVIIPARYESTRLPGKPLALIGSKPMIQHVYERALEAGASRVIVATDHQLVEECVTNFGGQVCMTDPNHQSGSDRLAEVCSILNIADTEIIVNVQGDEPFISPENIAQVANNLAKAITQNSNYKMATLGTKITDEADVFNPNVVKFVTDINNRALYFSRAPIAWQRGYFDKGNIGNLDLCQRHIGIYAYQAAFLRKFVTWAMADLEQLESLEQLRVLANGYDIHVDTAEKVPAHGVDTPEDLESANQYYQERN